MRKGQSGRFALFAIACITSPCCTPLLLPIVLILFAGTPAALWITQNLGWVYSVLTVISIVSLVMALRWNQHRKNSPPKIRPADIPVISSFGGEQAHVEPVE